MADSGAAQYLAAFASPGKITNFMPESPLVPYEQRKTSSSVDSDPAAEFANKKWRCGLEPEETRPLGSQRHYFVARRLFLRLTEF
jgi:hypothetical protein